MYKIGELSRLCKIPVKTLRFYDGEGLLVPDEVDRFTGYRYYRAARIADVNRIIALKELGFSLDEIRRRQNAGSPDELRVLLAAKETELKNTVLHAEASLSRLTAIRRIIEEGEIKMFDITIRGSNALRLAARRKVFKTKEEALAEIEKIKAELPKAILGSRAAIINYETEFRESDFDLAACVEITGGIPKNCPYEDITVSFPADAAVLVCKKDELDDAYRAIEERLEAEPCQIIGACCEIYHEDGTVELKIPVKKLSHAADLHRDDDINLPFENDPDVIGKWKFLDAVPSEEQFLYGHEKSHSGVWLSELYFLPGGEWFWAVAGWTKGWLYTAGDSPKYVYKNSYEIKQINGKKLLFISMKDYSHESRGGVPSVWVYEKVSDRAFSRDEISVCDNTDLPFIPDERMLGAWMVRDFMPDPTEFNAEKQNYPAEQLFFQQAEFKSDGSAACVNKKCSYILQWTKGVLINKKDKTASALEIKSFGGKEYLFIEWKSGDYTFGGRKPCWYVFTRA